MGEAVLVAIISGGLALIGTVITVLMTSRKTDENLRISQAVTDTKIDELTREVRLHNNFAQRMPVLEEKVTAIDKRIESIEKKVD